MRSPPASATTVGRHRRRVFDQDGLASLDAALRYCRERGLGMFEASDVVVPLSDECYTDHANMCAFPREDGTLT